MAKSDKAIIGACGEHYVAAYLSGCGLIVAMPRAGIPGCDLLVAREKGGHAIRVQVKTGTRATRKDKEVGVIYLWATSYKVIDVDDKHLWYAYVWKKEWPEKENLPEVFFVPSRVVASCMEKCRANNETYPFFWLRYDDAQQYKGQSGLELFLKALDA